MTTGTHKVRYRGLKGSTIYEYECTKCEYVQTERHSVQDNPKIICEKCGCEDMQRLIGSGNFILKGKDFPSKEHKIDQEIAKQDEIMAEGWRSQSEIETAKHMLKERDEQMVKDGRKLLPTDRGTEEVVTKNTVSKDQYEAIDKQINSLDNKPENKPVRAMLEKQKQRMREQDGKIVKRTVNKKVGEKALKKAAKKQREMINKR